MTPTEASGPTAPGEPQERRFLFRDAALSPITPAADEGERLLVADSWLVVDGSVRALDLHRERFATSALEQGFSNRVVLDGFWRAAVEAIPPIHRWFPRVELSTITASSPHAKPRFQLSLLMRLAPPATRSAVLRTHDGDDPRSIPGIKGPDLHTLTALRNRARADGVDDLVILDSAGTVIDGTTTAILWWRGDELHVPPATATRVDSVTARSIVVLARATGVPVVEEAATPAGLAGAEVWAVNALYGIRTVTRWQGVSERTRLTEPTVNPARAELWQRRLDSLTRPF
ncbi:aminotransferase class IV [Subtercola frigoramans]|uniref:Branched-subunit amino acid aminotransferase/4-amino-4-deoxychorismate lyase n=1 Tax=Subtercola frigoramans TaxID=120298 RepID=A0ABS2L6C7_9MICO|nr:aminotransferase class IV [Subtercola frigoramans]MBM7472634.1 branched-subunit amino acid aminotransferase/4-amino-4-deoxychorismate lyase [Subtercola frigoramans]